MTLLEVAIGMIVLGLLVTALIPFYKVYKTDKINTTTSGNQTRIINALTKHAIVFGRYPKPAERDLVYGDAAFGKETTASVAALSNCTIDDPDVCKDDGIRDTAADVDALNDLILRGDVPFVTLGLNELDMYDGYGNRFTYVVSAYQTDVVTYDDDYGTINMIEADGSTETNAAHYLIISHGRNGVGAYTSGGQLRAACNTADTSLGKDRENCDLDAVFTNNIELINTIDVFEQRMQVDVAGTNYYDDNVAYRDFLLTDNWARTASLGGSNIVSNITNNTAIKIGEKTDAIVNVDGDHIPDVKLNVFSGNIRVNDYVDSLGVSREGFVKVNKLCDNNDNSCKNLVTATLTYPQNTFTPAVIGHNVGTGPGIGNGGGGQSQIDGGGIRCGSERALSAISKSNEVCNASESARVHDPVLKSNFNSTFNCPSNTYPTGVDSTGKLICITP